MNISARLAVATLAVFAMRMAVAGDPQAGRLSADQTCSACHGKDGISIAAFYPNLCGQKSDYLVNQLKALRDGTRANPIMSPMAKNLTDTDIDNLADYFSTLRCP